jgi:peptidoglycan/xylan/chitin deacetylase (PgdA/CDA1 family)
LKKLSSFLPILVVFVFVAMQALAVRHDLPALCYHQVEPKASGKFSLSVEKFRQQLDYLRSRNFVSLNSEDIAEIMAGNRPVPENSIIITFDDGFRTVYDHAYPIMKEYGFKGIVCVYPAFIGSGKAMTWQQMTHLIQEGWSVESHTMTHANLTSMIEKPEAEAAFFEKEIVKSKSIIEQRLGNKVRYIVWPYGCYTQKSIETAKIAGYIGAMTVDGGASYSSLSPWQIKRQVVYANDDMNKFLIRLGMRALPVSEQYPAPGEVVTDLATFSCKLPELADYSPEKYVLNTKLTGKKISFNFDPQTRILSGTVSSALKGGNYFFDVYLRDRKTGITCQHGWLFTVRGGKIKSSY